MRKAKKWQGNATCKTKKSQKEYLINQVLVMECHIGENVPEVTAIDESVYRMSCSSA